MKVYRLYAFSEFSALNLVFFLPSYPEITIKFIKPKEASSRVPLVCVVVVIVMLVYLGHFGLSRLTEYLSLFQIILTLVSALALVSHCSTPHPPLNFYYSLTPHPSHRSHSHPLSGVLSSLVPYATPLQSISSSLSIPAIALQSISCLIRKQPVLLTATLALTLS